MQLRQPGDLAMRRLAHAYQLAKPPGTGICLRGCRGQELMNSHEAVEASAIQPGQIVRLRRRLLEAFPMQRSSTWRVAMYLRWGTKTKKRA